MGRRMRTAGDVTHVPDTAKMSPVQLGVRDTIARAGAELRDTIAREEAKERATADGFANFARSTVGDLPMVSGDFARIVDRVYRVDALKDYDRLEKAIRLGAARADRGSVMAAVDDAEDNARLAHGLFLNARVERVAWEAEAEVVMSSIRSEANRALQAEKTEGARNKAITDADVRSKMASLHPDEFRAYEERSAKLRGTEDHLARLADLWQSRCASTRVLADKSR